jgi:glycosyltransferase involved in cell wall biosynthesis
MLTWNRGVEEEASPLRKEMEEAGFPVDEIWVGKAPYGQGIWGLGTRLHYMIALARYVRSQNFDGVHAIDLDSALPLAVLRTLGLYDGAFVFDVADYIELYYTIPDLLGRAIGTISNWVLSLSDLIVIPDDNRRDRIPASLQSKATTVTNAPDFDEEFLEQLTGKASRTENLDVFYYGSLADDRGVSLMLKAAERLSGVSFWFAGWGKNEDAVVHAEKKLGNVSFFGMLSQEDVLRRAAGMDVIAMIYDPSYGVNQMASPNKLFEAMAIARPVLVARGTSIDEIVEDQEIGWAVDYEVDPLVKCLRSIEEQDVRERASRSANLYEKYKWPESAERLASAYRHILGY